MVSTSNLLSVFINEFSTLLYDIRRFNKTFVVCDININLLLDDNAINQYYPMMQANGFDSYIDPVTALLLAFTLIIY